MSDNNNNRNDRTRTGLATRVEYTATDKVAAAIARLGRTEDIRFSPDNRRLVVIGFKGNRILVIDVEVARPAGGTTVRLINCVDVESPEFHEPHGVCFLDDEYIIVANRRGLAPVVKLPPRGTRELVVQGEVVGRIEGTLLARLESPGSVAATPLGEGRYEVLFCNNYVHTVTRHVLDMRQGVRVRRNRTLLRRRLAVPDGVAIGEGGRWIAISNHNTHSVLMFENTRLLNPLSKPSATLRNVNYPHGLRFTDDDRFVVVADAGAPFVHVYARPEQGWAGSHEPVATHRVMDEATFLRGRYNTQEGGPKGIDIDRTGTLLATTCEHQVLSFFDLASMMSAGRDWPDNVVELPRRATRAQRSPTPAGSSADIAAMNASRE